MLDSMKSRFSADQMMILKTLAVVADFTKLKRISEYKEAIADKINHLNIGVLVLNAGWVQAGFFNDLYDWEVEKQMQILANHVVYTAKTCLP